MDSESVASSITSSVSDSILDDAAAEALHLSKSVGGERRREITKQLHSLFEAEASEVMDQIQRLEGRLGRLKQEELFAKEIGGDDDPQPKTARSSAHHRSGASEKKLLSSQHPSRSSYGSSQKKADPTPRSSFTSRRREVPTPATVIKRKRMKPSLEFEYEVSSLNSASSGEPQVNSRGASRRDRSASTVRHSQGSATTRERTSSQPAVRDSRSTSSQRRPISQPRSATPSDGSSLGRRVGYDRPPPPMAPPLVVPTRYVHSGSPFVATRVRALSLHVRQLDRNQQQQEALQQRQRNLMAQVREGLSALGNEMSLRRYIDPRTTVNFTRPMAHQGEV